MAPPSSSDEPYVWLLQVSRSMFGCRDVQRLLVQAVDAFVEVTGAERGLAFVHDPDTDKLVQSAARAAGGSDLLNNETRVVGLATQVHKERRGIFATEGTDDPASRRSVTDLRVKMLACVPLVTESGSLGVLYADGKAAPAGEANQRAAQILADHAAAALDNARMFERASNDLLTGLPNNSYFLMQLGKVMREATPEVPAGLLLLDLDAFKRVNLAAGAETGDRALIDIAHTLREVLRSDGLVSRYGSDKFAVLLPPEAGTSIGLRLRDVAERARAAVGTKAYHGVQLSASIGGIAYPTSPADSAPDLIALADDVLAKARARGAGQVEVEA